MYVGIWNSKIKSHIQIRWAKNYELFTNVVIIETKARAKKVSISLILKECS
jgi:hypothetical protein